MTTTATTATVSRESALLGQTVVTGATYDIDGGRQLVS